MGVPAFFRWLTLRYPEILIEAREDLSLGFDLSKIISNNTGNETQIPKIDNLYFDMNGIIHPCAHPEDRDSPSSITEMFNSIFDYCDKIIRIIKPKKLIYMAIDGVAPRAKMNQQRSRRFRTALESQQRERISKKIEIEWRNKNLPTDIFEKKNDFKFDSNTITPGTKFLYDCSIAIRNYIKIKINNDPLWKNLTVIFSDASVPGEGEHKILDFIRTQRTYENYDPNTFHCIYGADADLIMLSLIMHEPNFCVIRESLNDNYFLICEKCGKHGHRESECNDLSNKFDKKNATEKEIANFNKEKINEIEFSLLKIWVLREYLELEFNCLLKNNYNFERIIDDFVFLCFLVGNDFLPNMPSLKIREGAIDALIVLYKNILPKMNNYLTNGKGELNMKQCEYLFKKLSLIEDRFFKLEIENKIKSENYRKQNPQFFTQKNKNNLLETFRSIEMQNTKNNLNNNQKNNNLGNDDEINLIDIVGNITAIEKDEKLKKNFNLEELKKNGENKYKRLIKEEIYEENNKKVEQYIDKIKLGEVGWKDRYYMEKFHVSPKNNNKYLLDLKKLIKKYYIEGLFWVFEYYYNGCISWSWFYPFHYAPFASDLTDLSDIKIKFDLNRPFFAFEQLLSVLPPYSAKALPKCLEKLMKDPLSPIADYYPSDIKLDINGQPYAWMGVNLLPFIDAERIKKIVKNKIDKKEISDKELILNERGENLLITRNLNIEKIFDGILSLHPKFNTFNKEFKGEDEIKGLNLDDVKNDKSKIFIFKKKVNNKCHNSFLLNGVIKRKKTIIEDNLDNYPKTKFKGQQAIEIVKEVLGCENDNVEGYFMRETFDQMHYNNNRAVELDPQKMFLLMKKRHQENMEYMNMNRYNKNYQNNNCNNNNNNYQHNRNVSNIHNRNNNQRNFHNDNGSHTINLDENDEEKNVKKEDSKNKDDKNNNKKKQDDSLFATMNRMMICLINEKNKKKKNE